MNNEERRHYGTASNPPILIQEEERLHKIIAGKDAEIEELKSELALHEKWKNDTLNDLVTYKAHKDKEIQELKQRYEASEKGRRRAMAEIQHLKSSRVKDIEDAINFGVGLAFMPTIKSKEEVIQAKSEYLKPFTADSK
jgi:hypothetical protein